MDINKISLRYARQELLLIVALFLVTLLVSRVWLIDGLVIPAIVSALFSLVVGGILILVWRRVANGSPESLPTFFSAVSGFRLLLALGTMLVYYLVSDKEGVMLFFIVFMAFYFIMLAHHSIFFAKVSNQS